jgi:hypothetical protein
VIRRRTLVVLGTLLVAAVTRSAHAQTITGTAGTTGTTTTTNLVADDFFLAVQDENGVNFPPFDLARFFNKAACDCDTPVKIFASMSQQGFAKRSLVDQTAHIQVWIGNASCDNTLIQNTNCLRLIDESLAEFFAHGHETFETTARVLSTFTGSNGAIVDGGVVGATSTGFQPNTNCTSPISPFNQTIWLLVDTNGDSVNDVSPPATTAVQIDLTGPPTPDNINVVTGNEAVNVSWDKLDTTVNTDLQGYQVLCQRGSGLQVFANGTFSTPIKNCAKTQGMGIEGLDPLFVCSPLLSRATGSFRVKILQNGIPYGATVVAVDNSGNASVPEVHFAVPEKTDSFYDVYRMGDPTTAGQAAGGFCAIAPGAATGPLAVASGGALAFAAVLALRRRRRRP